jgi:hypothetical protein
LLHNNSYGKWDLSLMALVKPSYFILLAQQSNSVMTFPIETEAEAKEKADKASA